jgi:hypothetical protein
VTFAAGNQRRSRMHMIVDSGRRRRGARAETDFAGPATKCSENETLGVRFQAFPCPCHLDLVPPLSTFSTDVGCSPLVISQRTNSRIVRRILFPTEGLLRTGGARLVYQTARLVYQTHTERIPN